MEETMEADSTQPDGEVAETSRKPANPLLRPGSMGIIDLSTTFIYCQLLLFIDRNFVTIFSLNIRMPYHTDPETWCKLILLSVDVASIAEWLVVIVDPD